MGVPSFGISGHALSRGGKGCRSRAREVGISSPHAYQLILRSWAHLGLYSSSFPVYHIEIVFATAIHEFTFLQYARLWDIRSRGLIMRAHRIIRRTIFIFQYMVQPNLLSSGMLCACTPNHCTDEEFTISDSRKFLERLTILAALQFPCE
jgi:hypothetical protein